MQNVPVVIVMRSKTLLWKVLPFFQGKVCVFFVPIEWMIIMGFFASIFSFWFYCSIIWQQVENVWRQDILKFCGGGNEVVVWYKAETALWWAPFFNCIRVYSVSGKKRDTLSRCEYIWCNNSTSLLTITQTVPFISDTLNTYQYFRNVYIRLSSEQVSQNYLWLSLISNIRSRKIKH